MSDALLSVTHPNGSANAHRIATLTDEDRALIAPAGCSPAEFLVALSDQIADREAYERVCAAKGLLPL